jgi:hypothetical protein
MPLRCNLSQLTAVGSKTAWLAPACGAFRGKSDAIMPHRAPGYPQLAAQMRAEAAQMTDAEARRLMIELAASYERLARHLERREPEPEGEHSCTPPAKLKRRFCQLDLHPGPRHLLRV